MTRIVLSSGRTTKHIQAMRPASVIPEAPKPYLTQSVISKQDWMGISPHVQYDAYVIQSKINDWAFLGCVEGPVAGKRDHKTRLGFWRLLIQTRLTASTPPSPQGHPADHFYFFSPCGTVLAQNRVRQDTIEPESSQDLPYMFLGLSSKVRVGRPISNSIHNTIIVTAVVRLKPS